MNQSDSQQMMIDRFAGWGQNQPSVRAMLLTSSRTVPNGVVDVLSDYDVILVTTDIQPYHAHRGWLSDFGRVLTLYRDPILPEGGFETSGYIVQYEEGLKIDFTLWPVAYMRQIVDADQLPAELDAGYLVLLDKYNLTSGLRPPSYQAYIPTPPTETQYQEAIEVFFLDTIYMAKYLWREDMVAAKHMLDHFIKHEHLIPMLTWHFEITRHWTVKPSLFGRRLKHWLRPDLWDKLAVTYTGFDLQANWTALFDTIDLYRLTAIEVGENLGYAYPHDLEQRVQAYIQKIRHLDR
ncbi:MAG: hypothetical protein CL610_26695 [Anaerolineaceae bacterium]|nr:hypothetical protein [Anaerolineaceae bacterium]